MNVSAGVSNGGVAAPQTVHGGPVAGLFSLSCLRRGGRGAPELVQVVVLGGLLGVCGGRPEGADQFWRARPI